MTRKTIEVSEYANLWLMEHRGAGNVKDKVDELIESAKTHLVQEVKGRILIGNAGLSKKQIMDGYVAMLCTADANNRFVDIAVTREQLSDLIDVLTHEINLLDCKE